MRLSLLGRRGVLAALFLIMAACAPRQDVRGAVLDPARVDAIQPGRHTQAQVADMLGTPTATSTFAEHNRTWYYITKETETVAFFREKVIDQQVVAIDFDQDGRVKDVRNYGLEDGKEIEVVERATPTKGRELGFLEQIFGNIGRFNNENTGQANR